MMRVATVVAEMTRGGSEFVELPLWTNRDYGNEVLITCFEYPIRSIGFARRGLQQFCTPESRDARHVLSSWRLATFGCHAIIVGAGRPSTSFAAAKSLDTRPLSA